MPWFSVRSVVKFDDDFEERIVVFEGADFDAAIARAESESQEYVETLGCGEVLDLFQAYQLPDEPADGTEVFSLIRSSALDATTYLDRHFDTGTERQALTQ
jgi:hypothetical protein